MVHSLCEQVPPPTPDELVLLVDELVLVDELDVLVLVELDELDELVFPEELEVLLEVLEVLVLVDELDELDDPLPARMAAAFGVPHPVGPS